MNCATCKVNKIGPNTAPYGGFMCDNEHLQCRDCNARADGQCGVCENSTNFVQMNYNTPSGTLTASQAPSAPPLEGDSHTGPSEHRSSSIFPKEFFARIETQSSISQEHLSMQESNDTKSEQGKVEELSQQPKQEAPAPPSTPVNADKLVAGETQSSRRLLSMQPFQPAENGFSYPELPRLETASATQGVNMAKLSMRLKRSTDSRINALMAAEDIKNKASLGVVDDIDDSHIIHTSEIRFMESTESLKNYYSGGTMHPSLKSKTEQLQHSSHQESLSMKVLHDFETHNTAHPSELVENYLRNYGPLALCHFPAYSMNHNCYHGQYDPTWVMQRQAHVRSICVSTESEPSLAGNCLPIKLDLPPKYLPPEIFVMQATGVAEPSPESLPNPEKIAQPSIDIRMQKVLETFQEDPRQPKMSQKPLLDQQKNFVKIPVPELQPAQGALGVDAAEVEHASVNETPEKTALDIISLLSNSHRAYYNPPSGVISTMRNGSCQPVPEPPPQYQLVTCSTLVANEIALNRARYLSMKPVPACQLNIPRAPIQCPESWCHRMIFVSDFNKHLIVDHSKLPMERIASRQCKNFFIDPRLSHYGVSKCHLLYLIRDKITDLGSSKFKDFLPLLVMSTRIKLSELCGIPEAERAHLKCDMEFLMIWLTGIVPEEFPVPVSLTVWPRSGQVPSCHLVHSGGMYSIRKSQHVLDICASGQMMLLSAAEVNQLSNDGKEMLELQIVVH